MAEAEEFMAALARDLQPQERLILCGFGGNPFTADPHAWKPNPWRPGREIDMPTRWNVYTTVASFGRAGDNSFRRRTETFSAGLALMVDDVGTKVDPSVTARLRPTAAVETSPGNFQLWYMLSTPERDMARFDGVIRAFISGRLLGADPGMSGVTRVGRIPGYTNGKPTHNGWRCKMHELADRRYSVQELLDAFDLKLNGRRMIREKLPTDEALSRNAAFGAAYKFLAQRRMLKRDEPDPSGWTEMTCPWVDDHTGGADTGAAIREPSPENDYYGAFRCHHGHCADKGWADLTDFINDLAVEELEDANR